MSDCGTLFKVRWLILKIITKLILLNNLIKSNLYLRATQSSHLLNGHPVFIAQFVHQSLLDLFDPQILVFGIPLAWKDGSGLRSVVIFDIRVLILYILAVLNDFESFVTGWKDWLPKFFQILFV